MFSQHSTVATRPFTFIWWAGISTVLYETMCSFTGSREHGRVYVPYQLVKEELPVTRQE
jgi:hypothetical protein